MEAEWADKGRGPQPLAEGVIRTHASDSRNVKNRRKESSLPRFHFSVLIFKDKDLDVT